MRKTGGGPPSGPLSESTTKFIGMMPAQMTSLENEYDCDADATIVVTPNAKKAARKRSPVVRLNAKILGGLIHAYI